MEKETKKELNLADALLLLCKGIKKGIICCGQAFLWLLRFCYKSKWALLVCVAIGFAWGFWASTDDKQIYKAEFCLQIDEDRTLTKEELKKPIPFDSQYCQGIIHTLDVLLKNRDKSKKEEENEKLANLLNIGTEMAEAICSIKSYHIVNLNRDGFLDYVDYNNKYRSDTLNPWDKYTLQVEIEAKDPSVFPFIKDGILSMLNNDKNVQDEMEFRINREKAYIQLAAEEMLKLDQLQTKVFSESNQSIMLGKENGNTTILGENKVQMFFGIKEYVFMSMSKRKHYLKEHSNGFARVDKPILYKGVVNTRQSEIIVHGLLCFGIGFLLCLYWKYRKNIQKFLLS